MTAASHGWQFSEQKKQKANEWAKVWTNLTWWKITVTRSLLIRMASAIDFSVMPSMNWLKMSYYALCQLPVKQKLHSTQSNYGWELSLLWSMPASFGNFLSSEALNHLKQASDGVAAKINISWLSTLISASWVNQNANTCGGEASCWHTTQVLCFFISPIGEIVSGIWPIQLVVNFHYMW